jgi:hypothetical protein
MGLDFKHGHSDMKTTLQLYPHSISEDRMAAQGQMLEAIPAIERRSRELRHGGPNPGLNLG